MDRRDFLLRTFVLVAAFSFSGLPILNFPLGIGSMSNITSVPMMEVE
jgi:hypothetical protein